MLNKIWKVFLIIALICFIGYFGVCAFHIYQSTNQSQPVEAPKATYGLTIKSTGKTIYSDNVSVADDSPGYRRYSVTGYWERVNGDYNYKNVVLIIDERYFGEIKLWRCK